MNLGQSGRGKIVQSGMDMPFGRTLNDKIATLEKKLILTIKFMLLSISEIGQKLILAVLITSHNNITPNYMSILMLFQQNQQFLLNIRMKKCVFQISQSIC